VTRFMGEGRLEAAQTELHQAQTAIAAGMAEQGVASVTGTTLEFGPTNDLDVDGDDVGDCQQFLHGPLTAQYTVNAAGNITGVSDDGVFGDGVCWDGTSLQWTDVGC
jgi:hypothetical protein